MLIDFFRIGKEHKCCSQVGFKPWTVWCWAQAVQLNYGGPTTRNCANYNTKSSHFRHQWAQVRIQYSATFFEQLATVCREEKMKKRPGIAHLKALQRHQLISSHPITVFLNLQDSAQDTFQKLRPFLWRTRRHSFARRRLEGSKEKKSWKMAFRVQCYKTLTALNFCNRVWL